MSLISGIFSGMEGTKDAKVVVPKCGLMKDQLTNSDVLLGRYGHLQLKQVMRTRSAKDSGRISLRVLRRVHIIQQTIQF